MLTGAAVCSCWLSPALGATPSRPITVDRDGACTAIPPTRDTPGALLTAVAGTPISYSRDPAQSARVDESTKVTSEVDVERELRPGDAFTCVITIRNRHHARTRFDLATLGVMGAPGAGIAIIGVDDKRAAQTAANWLDPSASSVTLPTLGVAKVPVTVTVPPEPPVGAAYAFLQITPRTPATGHAAAGPAVGVTPSVAVSFLLRIGGAGRARLDLTHEHAPRVRWNRATFRYNATLVNTGTLHARPSGRLRVRSIFGATVAQLDISGRTLLPRGSEPVAVRWRSVPWIGLYRYDVRVAGGNGSAAVGSGWFVALPPWWVVVIAVVLVAALVAGAVARRRYEARWHAYLDEGDIA